jgi:hypothetical protein
VKPSSTNPSTRRPTSEHTSRRGLVKAIGRHPRRRQSRYVANLLGQEQLSGEDPVRDLAAVEGYFKSPMSEDPTRVLTCAQNGPNALRRISRCAIPMRRLRRTARQEHGCARSTDLGVKHRVSGPAGRSAPAGPGNLTAREQDLLCPNLGPWPLAPSTQPTNSASGWYGQLRWPSSG